MLFSCHPPTSACLKPRASVAKALPLPKGSWYDQLNTTLCRVSQSELPRFVARLNGFCGATRFPCPLELSMLCPHVQAPWKSRPAESRLTYVTWRELNSELPHTQLFEPSARLGNSRRGAMAPGPGKASFWLYVRSM